MIRKIRKWWLCKMYGLCPVHGDFLPLGGYGEGQWGQCPTCVRENEAKNIHRTQRDHLARVGAQKQLCRDWAIRPATNDITPHAAERGGESHE